MTTVRKLFLGSAMRTVLSVLQMAIGFFMMPFLVANLGDHWYGIWSVLGSSVAYMSIMDAGLASAVGYYLTKHLATDDHDSVNAVINTALVMYGAVAVLVLIATAILASSIGLMLGNGADTHVAALVIIILGTSLAMDFPFSSFGGIIGAKLRYELHSYSRFIIVSLNTLLTIYFVKRGYGILALAIIGIFTAQLSNVFFFAISKHLFPQLKLGYKWFDRSLVRSLMGYSIWSFLSGISSILKFRLHSVVIASTLGATSVTHFLVGSRLADYYREMLLQATNLTTPVLTRYHALQQMHEIREKLVILTKFNTILACFGGGMIIVLGKTFIATWMGPDYIDAYPVLVVLILAMAIEVILDPARGVMFASGNNRFMGIFELVEAILTVGLCIVLVKTYGILGVALGTAIPLFALKLIIVPRAVCNRIHLGLGTFYRSMLPALALTVAYVAAYGWLANRYLLSLSYPRLLIAGLLSLPAYAVLALTCLLEAKEIELLRGIWPWRRRVR